MQDELRSAAADAGLDAAIFNPDAAPDSQRFKALVFDASGIADSEQLHEAWAFLHPAIRRVQRCGRVIVLGTPPEDCDVPAQAVAQRALEGLSRAIGKEIRKGAHRAAGLRAARRRAGARVDAALLALAALGLRLRPGRPRRPGREHRAARRSTGSARSTGKVALVTGAARGIGAAIAEVLARDGAHVVGLDIPAMSEELTAGIGRDRRVGAGRRHHRRRARPRRSPRTCSSSTRASTSSSTTPA